MGTELAVQTVGALGNIPKAAMAAERSMIQCGNAIYNTAAKFDNLIGLTYEFTKEYTFNNTFQQIAVDARKTEIVINNVAESVKKTEEAGKKAASGMELFKKAAGGMKGILSKMGFDLSLEGIANLSDEAERLKLKLDSVRNSYSTLEEFQKAIRCV